MNVVCQSYNKVMMMKRKHVRVSVLLLLVGAGLFLTGCDQNIYELLIQPQGDGFQRHLTCFRADLDAAGTPLKPFPQEELNRLTTLYGLPQATAKAEKYDFKGAFQTAPPQDIGGAGQYLRWPTAPGTLYYYSERFRGNDALDGALQARLQAAEQLLDLLHGWWQTQLGKTADWVKLDAFLSGELRADLRNFVLYGWLAVTAADAGLSHGGSVSPEEVVAMRMFQYLAERQYLLPEEVAQWQWAMQQSDENGQFRQLASWTERCLCRKLKLPSESPLLPQLDRLLADKSRAGKSFADYLVTTAVWQRRLKEWQDRRRNEPQLPDLDPLQIPSDLAGQLLIPGLAPGRGDRITVRLATPVKPFLASGAWDEANRQMVWADGNLTGGDRLPFMVYAVWAVPDDTFQQAHFGATVLSGQKLGDYIFWYKSLGPVEKAEWDKFLVNWKPDSNPAPLRYFHFSEEAVNQVLSEEELNRSRAAPGRCLLLEVLKIPR